MNRALLMGIIIMVILIVFFGCNRSPIADSPISYEEVEITVDEAVINRNDAYKAIEPLWWSVSIYDGEKQYIEDLKRFTVQQKYVFAIEWYMAEVNNGGHDQFYFNSTGIVWEDAMKGFEAVGLKENYEILKESAERLGGNPSKDRFKRQKQLDKNESGFDDLDDKFYKSEDKIEEVLMRYIKDNKNDFLFKGIVKMPI